MKKQVQKIKENKGFSMIELIIVVAIMAILVGIIGAALIPYMEKSRASKDKSALDSVYNAFASAIAESEDPSKLVGSGGSLTSDGQNAVESLLDGTISDLQGKFKSKQFKDSSGNGAAIKFFITKDGKNYGVYIAGGNDYSGVQIDSSGTEYKVSVKVKGTITSTTAVKGDGTTQAVGSVPGSTGGASGS